MSFRILGTGSCLPQRSVSNEELSASLDTSDEWISQRVGIRERRVCTSETTTDLALGAARAALDMSGLSPNDLDMIICATVSADNSAPSLACEVQAMLGAKCPAMDINAGCSGFIYALETAAGFFARGADNILVVGAERLTRLVDWTDRGTAVIFADGAGAMILGAGDSFVSSKLSAKGNDAIIRIPNHSGESPYYENTPAKPYIYMNGPETFKFAINAMCTDLVEVTEAAGITLKDVTWVIPHQANARIIDAAMRKLDLPPECCLKNIEKIGNTSAASVAIVFDELNRSGKLRDGDYIAMTVFGAGLTSAACVIRW